MVVSERGNINYVRPRRQAAVRAAERISAVIAEEEQPEEEWMEERGIEPGRWVNLEGNAGEQIVRETVELLGPKMSMPGDAISETISQIAYTTSASLTQNVATKALVSVLNNNPLQMASFLPTQGHVLTVALHTAVSMTPESMQNYIYSGGLILVGGSILGASWPIVGVLFIGVEVSTWLFNRKQDVDWLAEQEQLGEEFFKEMTGLEPEEASEELFNSATKALEHFVDDLDVEELTKKSVALIEDIDIFDDPDFDPDDSPDDPGGGGGKKISSSADSSGESSGSLKRAYKNAMHFMRKFWSWVKYAAVGLLHLASGLLAGFQIVWWIIMGLGILIISLKK